MLSLPLNVTSARILAGPMSVGWIVAALLPCVAARAQPPTDDAGGIRAEVSVQTEGPIQVLGSEHFRVYTDADLRLARALMKRLEATYRDVARFCEVNRIPGRTPAQPLDVIFFERPEVYHRYAEAVGFRSQGTLGFFHADTNRSTFFNSENDPRLAQVHEQIDEARRKLDRRKVAELENLLELYEAQINQMVVQHESAHMILYNIGVHNQGASNPMWLVEGLAMLFEPAPTDQGSGFEAINQFRLFDFREALRDGRDVDRLTVADFRRAVDLGHMVELTRLVTDGALWQAEGPIANNYYAQAWALTHYLQRTKREAWSQYINAIRQRKPGESVTAQEELALFEETFGPLDEKFTQRWARYILRLPAPQVLAKIH